jgi:hypothetical protein
MVARGHKRAAVYIGCDACGKPLTASWSKGRREYYATRLQPTPGYMRLVKDRVLRAWRDLKTEAKQRIAIIERKQKAIQQKLDRLDEAFLFERTIDIERYDRQRDKLREELTLVQMDRHTSELEEMDVEGILAFAERVLPSASNLWVQAALDQKQRLQKLFFPEGLRFDGKRLVGTGTTPPDFQLLEPCFERQKKIWWTRRESNP